MLHLQECSDLIETLELGRTNFCHQEKGSQRSRDVEMSKKVSPSSQNTKHIQKSCRTILRYCSPVWGSCGSTAMNYKNFKIGPQEQFQTADMMLLQSLSLIILGSTLLMKLFKQRICMVYGSSNCLTATYLTEVFSRPSDKCKRTTNTVLEILSPKSAYG